MGNGEKQLPITNPQLPITKAPSVRTTLNPTPLVLNEGTHSYRFTLKLDLLHKSDFHCQTDKLIFTLCGSAALREP